MQLELSLIPHKIDGKLIHQRATDGYVNATAMCNAVGKLFADYRRLKTTEDFLQELESDMGIPISQLVVSLKGNTSSFQQGTWVHPDIAVHLALWCSPKFAVAVSRWVREWMSGKFTTVKLPYHLERYMANRKKIPHTHFSMLNELTLALIAPLEDMGYTLPEDMVPDISEGKMFSAFLRSKGVNTSVMLTYQHDYKDGRVVAARLYPISVMAAFREHFYEVWMPTRALEYFEKRDPKALPHLQKMLPDVKFKQLID